MDRRTDIYGVKAMQLVTVTDLLRRMKNASADQAQNYLFLRETTHTYMTDCDHAQTVLRGMTSDHIKPSLQSAQYHQRNDASCVHCLKTVHSSGTQHLQLSNHPAA
jgi:hypothetical protein